MRPRRPGASGAGARAEVVRCLGHPGGESDGRTRNALHRPRRHAALLHADRAHVIRHLGDIEMLHTYEGTETMQTLIVGRDITGVSAFA